jgi:hypothetical protein
MSHAREAPITISVPLGLRYRKRMFRLSDGAGRAGTKSPSRLKEIYLALKAYNFIMPQPEGVRSCCQPPLVLFLVTRFGGLNAMGEDHNPNRSHGPA